MLGALMVIGPATPSVDISGIEVFSAEGERVCPFFHDRVLRMKDGIGSIIQPGEGAVRRGIGNIDNPSVGHHAGGLHQAALEIDIAARDIQLGTRFASRRNCRRSW
jgi:hypothetical protein